MHDEVYHWDGSWFQLFVIPILDFCVFWLLLALVLFFSSGRLRIAIWCGLIALTPWIELNNWGYLAHKNISSWLSVLVLVLGVAAFPLLLALWRSKFEAKFEQVEELATAVFIFSAFCGILILSSYAWFGWRARSLNAKLPLPAVHDRPAQVGRPRIFWIVLDELSYQQVYERRFPGLQLPAFDALAAQATVFTHAIPAGTKTEVVLPSLLTGNPIDDIRPSSSGDQLLMHNPNASSWQRFNEHDTVFQDALNLNYSTSVVGWYNPYCRLLPNVLDRCFWSFSPSAKNTMVPRAPFHTNLIQPWIHFFREGMGYRFASLFVKFLNADELDAEQHISDYVALSDAADRIFEDQSAGFTLIHMPVPHPNGIYDRRTNKFVLAHSTYLDNVALSDKFLEHVRSKLEESGQWDSSAIVVMGDHSWRTTSMWRDMPEWTKEEHIASQGDQYDERPAYIVKLPGQKAGAIIDAPFAALNTRMLLDALLAQKIRSNEELSAWVMQSGH